MRTGGPHRASLRRARDRDRPRSSSALRDRMPCTGRIPRNMPASGKSPSETFRSRAPPIVRRKLDASPEPCDTSCVDTCASVSRPKARRLMLRAFTFSVSPSRHHRTRVVVAHLLDNCTAYRTEPTRCRARLLGDSPGRWRWPWKPAPHQRTGGGKFLSPRSDLGAILNAYSAVPWVPAIPAIMGVRRDKPAEG